MQALRLPGRITDDGILVVDQPEDLVPGEVEVIVLYREESGSTREVLDVNSHPAFGIWSDIPASISTAEFAQDLRRKVETRGDQID